MNHPTNQEIRTITVADSFGSDKQITKEAYVQIWRDHAAELHRISYENYDAVNLITAQVGLMASNEFEAVYNKQNPSCWTTMRAPKS